MTANTLPWREIPKAMITDDDAFERMVGDSLGDTTHDSSIVLVRPPWRGRNPTRNTRNSLIGLATCRDSSRKCDLMPDFNRDRTANSPLRRPGLGLEPTD